MRKRITSTINEPLRSGARICTVLKRIRDYTRYVAGYVVRRVLA